jgi:hypothetical protein
VVDFTGEAGIEGTVEVRGVLNDDDTISFGQLSKYSDDFKLEQYEEMVDYFQGMCKNLCV